MFCYFQCTAGQEKNELVSSYINNLTEIWNDLNTKTFTSAIIDPSLNFKKNEPFKLSNYSNFIPENQTKLQLNKLQQKINKKAIGLQATLSYQENLRSPVADPEEIFIFRRRVIAGIDWDLFNGGLYENRIKNKILKLNYDLLIKKEQESSLKNFHNTAITQLISFLNIKKIEILDVRKKLNDQQIEIVEKLWDIKHITKDDYLKVIQNSTDINSQYNLYKIYNQVNPIKNKTNKIELPVLEININKLLQKVENNYTDSALTCADEIAKYQASYLKDIGLKAYTRYNYYDIYNSRIPNRAYISVGMNLTLPLTFNQKDKREYYYLQYTNNSSKSIIDSVDFKLSILNKYYEYQYKLKQFKNFYHKRLVFEELLRTERVKAELGDLEFNPNTALLILDDYWSNAIELLDLKQELYKILLDFKTKMPTFELSEYTNVIDLNNLKINPTSPSLKAVYIWSDAFINNSQTLINEYCKINEFSPLLISYNTDKNHLKTISEFIPKLKSNKVHILIGSNKLLKTGIKDYLDSLKTNLNLSKIKGIHLDIEPHTFPDFKDNKTTYFKKYLDLLIEAKQFANNNRLELSVSIPLNYPEDVLKALNSNCNYVYLMAYENVDVSFILKKSVEERSILKNKCVLALRTKDFINRTKMEEAFGKLGFDKIAYHDLDDLIKFDNFSINNKEDINKQNEKH